MTAMLSRPSFRVVLIAVAMAVPARAEQLSLQALVMPSTVLSLKDGHPITFALHGFLEFKSLNEMFSYIDSQNQRWRGNVRELESEMARLVALSSANVPCGADLLSDRIRNRGNSPSAISSPATPVAPMSLHEMEKQLIFSVLQHTGGNRTRAAEILGISREGLRTKLQRFQIPADSDPL
jgi:hypothetical protein